MSTGSQESGGSPGSDGFLVSGGAPPAPAFTFRPGHTIRFTIRTKHLTPSSIAVQQNPNAFTHVHCRIVNCAEAAPVGGLVRERVPVDRDGQEVEFVWRVPQNFRAPQGVLLGFYYESPNGEVGKDVEY